MGLRLDLPITFNSGTASGEWSWSTVPLADQQVSLSAMGSHTFPEESLDNFWQEELKTRGETVAYKFKKENYYVISGVNPNGYEFYHKVFFYPTYWLEFEMTYPHAQHAIYDAWAERIAHDIVPVLPDNGQYDR
jgi:hypothetical protein